MNLDEALDILRGRVPEQDPDRVTEAEQTLLPIVEAATAVVRDAYGCLVQPRPAVRALIAAVERARRS